MRKQLFGHKEAVYSGYTCYTGIADFVPADIETVGYVDSCIVYLFILSWEAYLNYFAGRYRVFLGHKQYFVSSDVGAGKMQWYAFHKEPPGGVDGPNGMHSMRLRFYTC